MSIRRQLPAWSPVSVGGLAAGLAALARGGSHPERRLESLIQAELGAQQVLLVDSGTSALRLAFAAVADGGRVALPAWGCYDLATATLGAGVRALLYDLDPETLGPEPASFQRVLAEKPDGVLLAHWFGVPVPPVAFAAARASGAVVIEDAAQGVGGLLNGRPLGAHGSLAVLSFGRGKGRTGGSGGALVANDEVGERMLSRLREDPAGVVQRLTDAQGRLVNGRRPRGAGSLARLSAQWLLGRPAWYGLPTAIPWLRLGETVFHSPWPPSPIPRSAAGVIGAMWHASAAEAGVRRLVAERWLTVLQATEGTRPVRPPEGAEPGWLRFPVLTDSPARLASPEGQALGISPGYPEPLGLLPGFAAAAACEAVAHEGAARLATSLFTVPTHSRLSAVDLYRLEALLGSS